MVVRISDKTQNYSKVTKLLVKPSNLLSKILVSVITVLVNYFLCKSHIFSKKEEMLYEQN